MATSFIPSIAINAINLGNLLVPASGTTHALVLTVALNNSTSQLNMTQLVGTLGYSFKAQAMTIDNTGNAASVTVHDIVSGFTEIVRAGIKRTFQFPAVDDAQYTFTSAGSATFQALLYDYPAFPDTSGSSGDGSVTIAGQPIEVTVSPPNVVYTAGDNVAVETGGTPVHAFNGGSIANGGVIINPTTNTAQLFVDPVTDATTAEGHNGTCIALNPGDSFECGQASGPISVNSVAAVSFIAYRF